MKGRGSGESPAGGLSALAAFISGDSTCVNVSFARILDTASDKRPYQKLRRSGGTRIGLVAL